MLKLVLVVSVFTLMACGKKSFESDSKTTASSSAPPPDIVDLPTPVLNPEQTAGIANLLNGLIWEIMKGFDSLDGDFDFSNSTATVNQGFSCPISGTVAVAGQAQVNANIGLTSLQASLAGVSGSVAFSLCKLALPNGEILTLNGTLNLTALSGSVNGVYDLGGGTFTATNSSNWSGSLQVSVGQFNNSCAFALNHAANGAGQLDASFYATGSVNLQVTGSACNQNLNSQYSANLY